MAKKESAAGLAILMNFVLAMVFFTIGASQKIYAVVLISFLLMLYSFWRLKNANKDERAFLEQRFPGKASLIVFGIAAFVAIVAAIYLVLEFPK